MREEIIAWSIAWDGYITIQCRNSNNVRKYQPVVAVSNTDLVLLSRFQKMAGIGNITHCGNRYDWRISNLTDVYNLLIEIIPYLPAKEKRAELFLAFCESRLNSRALEDPGHSYYTQKEIAIAERFRNGFK